MDLVITSGIFSKECSVKQSSLTFSISFVVKTFSPWSKCRTRVCLLFCRPKQCLAFLDLRNPNPPPPHPQVSKAPGSFFHLAFQPDVIVFLCGSEMLGSWTGFVLVFCSVALVGNGPTGSQCCTALALSVNLVFHFGLLQNKKSSPSMVANLTNRESNSTKRLYSNELQFRSSTESF